MQHAFSNDADSYQAQLRGFARSIAEIEWLLLILVVLYLYVTRPDLAHDFRVIGALVGFTGFVLVFRYARLFARTHIKIVVEILAMVGFLTVILSLVGHEATPLVNLYLLPIITASLALGKRSTVWVLGLVSVCYVLLAVFASRQAMAPAALATETVSMLAPFVLVAFLTTLLMENVRSSSARIDALADRDELTRVLNMDAFVRMLAREHAGARGTEKCYSLLMLDISHLKLLNDACGHQAGNLALRLVADTVLRVLRRSDVMARYGGDEFIVYLPDADHGLGEQIAQRIRNVVFGATLELGGRIFRLQVNVGVATFPDHGETTQSLIAMADRAMYKDKTLRGSTGRLALQ